MIPEFARLYATGERRSPATAAVAQLISEGVDPNDPTAIDAWLEANRHRLDERLSRVTERSAVATSSVGVGVVPADPGAALLGRRVLVGVVRLGPVAAAVGAVRELVLLAARLGISRRTLCVPRCSSRSRIAGGADVVRAFGHS